LVDKPLTPANAQRLRLFDTYRGRGHRNNNLFLVYSVKTDQDWVLPSDRHLVHWIYYLETDSNVRDFAFVSGSDSRNSGLCSVDVLLENGTRIEHQVGRKNAEQSSEALEPKTEPSIRNVASTKIRIFTDEDLQPHVKTSLRWLKPISFASALRDQEYARQTLMLLDYFNQQASGDIGRVLEEPQVCEHASAIILGLIVRLAIKGHIRLDLSANSFGFGTRWTLPVKER